MTRTQIQLPDELYQRAKAFAAERELSLAEITRRGLELFLDRFPSGDPPRATWQLPKVDGGGIKIPLESLRDSATADEAERSLSER
ncbi:MAG: antitoxin [Verrucomicrobiaceae bacterium]|nr:MAG: antitoxin [Verrucomicrobiaceae bacterium]